jgi:hypothetical protein
MKPGGPLTGRPRGLRDDINGPQLNLRFEVKPLIQRIILLREPH